MTPADRERLSELLAGLEDTTHHNHGEWTTRGYELLAEAQAIVDRPENPMVGRMNHTDRADLAELLDKLAIAINRERLAEQITDLAPAAAVTNKRLAEARAIVNQPDDQVPDYLIKIKGNVTSEMRQAILDAFDREPRGSLMSLGPPRTIDLTLPGPLGRLWATIKRATSANTHPKGKP
jgi:hypothetical protein